jgi:hypothetical protein
MTDRELMQQALSVLCNNVRPRDGVRDNRHLTPKSHAAIYQQTVDALFNKLAQPEPGPVGKFAKFTDEIWREVTDGSPGVPLYAYPSYGLMGGDEFISKDSAKRMIV